MKNLILPLALVCTLLAGCNSGSRTAVDYRKADGYFVRNDFQNISAEMKFDSSEEFDKVFGMAATMSSRPTPIDFSREYVVAVVLRETDRATDISVDSLLWTGRKLDLYYSIKEGAAQSFTTRPAMLLVVDRKYDGLLDAVANAYDRDQTVSLVVRDGKASATVDKQAGQTVTFSFDAGDYTRLRANLSSEAADANVRISQIIMPDGSADGPFGREMEYELTQRGTYQLIVNENIMAGDPWAGQFTIDIELSNKSTE